MRKDGGAESTPVSAFCGLIETSGWVLFYDGLLILTRLVLHLV